MKKPSSIKDIIHLRALSTEDARTTWKWRNQEDIRNDFSGHPFHVSYQDELSWYEKNIKANFPDTTFGVETHAGILVGITFLKSINLINRHAEFAIIIDGAQKGKGYGKAACWETLQFGFLNLGLNRIYLRVRAENSAAINLYQACGFKSEGVLRESVYKQGRFSDQLMMSVLAKDLNFEK